MRRPRLPMWFGSALAGALLLPVLAGAQPPPAATVAAPAEALPDPATLAASPEIQALVANARKIHKPGEPLVEQRIASMAPFNLNLEYRTGAAPPAVHLRDAELIYVLDGSGELVSGGRLVGETRKNPNNLGGTDIDGGQRRHIAKGDVILVPKGSPHWIDQVDGELFLISMHLPPQAG